MTSPLQRRPYLTVPIAILCALLLTLAPGGGARAQDDQRCFAETPFCIAGRIRAFWEQGGGLAVFGLPIGPQQEEQVEGQALTVQWFERNRIELHPENQPPYDVLIGRLGVDRLAQQGRDWFSFPRGEAQPGCRFFAETGHNICGEILAAWRASGLEIDGRAGKSEAESLALFGLPLSDLMTETLSDGRSYSVQWFERARFELHPENQPPYNVLLGLLGKELRDNTAPPPPPPLNLSGNWRGPTSQGKAMGFVVADNSRIVEITFELDIPGCSLISIKTSGNNVATIADNRFTIDEGGQFAMRVEGSFSSDAAAAGTMELRVNQSMPGCPAGTGVTMSWTAAKQ